jgi:hypothetical protein
MVKKMALLMLVLSILSAGSALAHDPAQAERLGGRQLLLSGGKLLER